MVRYHPFSMEYQTRSVGPSTAWHKRKRSKISLRAFSSSRRLPIFTSRFQLTILGTSELNYCVRNGNRWNLTVIVTDHMTDTVYHISVYLSSISLQSSFSNRWQQQLDCVSQQMLFSKTLYAVLR